MTFMIPSFAKGATALVLALGLITPALAQADGRDPGYDGYCYQQKDRAETNGAVLGAVLGGVIGNSVAGRGSRGEGTVLGAVAGTMIGSSAGRGSVTCDEGRYYSYEEQGYYAPPPPPPGQVVVYYRERPRFYDDRTVVIYERGPRYYSRGYYAPRYYEPRYYEPRGHYRRGDRHDHHHDRGRW